MMGIANNRRQFLLSASAASVAFALPASKVSAQIIETNRYRVVTGIDVPLPYVGTVQSRSTNEITGSNWLIGCETLDRDFADYHQYKEFIAPLGIKRLRMQGGWAKTEKVRGQYDFTWLDSIINDAVGRGFEPWLQTSYGNRLYPGGGGDNLGAGMPVSQEALAAYDRWVTAMVTRYRNKVFLWEVWNEPNFADNAINTPEMTADFNVRTAEIIKRIQPTAKISGLALGHFNQRFVDRFFDAIAAKNKFDLFDNMTYHDYVYNPDFNHHEVMLIRASLERYTKRVKLRQGENGAPSAGGGGRGALWDYPWTELTQAKWNTRRMLGNLGQDIESSVFGLVEMNYTSGPINRLNLKGILKSDASLRVIRPKVAYYSIQNVTSIFDDSLERIRDLKHINTISAAAPSENVYKHSTDRRVAVFGYKNKRTSKQVYTLWLSENIPTDTIALSLQEFTVTNGDFDQPVWVDIITGAVHDIPSAQWSKTGSTYTFRGLPIYDAPVVLADKSLLKMTA
jgi:hypothetical protein